MHIADKLGVWDRKRE